MFAPSHHRLNGSTCKVSYFDRIVTKTVSFASTKGNLDTWNVISAVRELSTLGILRTSPHENCVNVFCVEYHDISSSCMFTFIREKMDLSQFITSINKSAPYSNITFEIMVQIGRGICHLHKLGIVHCDIKTENVLISCDDKIQNVCSVLCDYGMCRTDNSVLPTDQDVVTFSYRPPEHMANAFLVQTSSDCWSYGVLIVAILTQKPHPFGNKSHSLIISNVCKFLGNNWPCQPELLALCDWKLQCATCDNEADNGKHTTCRKKCRHQWERMMQNDHYEHANGNIFQSHLRQQFPFHHKPKSEVLMALSKLFTINSNRRPSLQAIMHEMFEDCTMESRKKRQKNAGMPPSCSFEQYDTLRAINNAQVWQDNGSPAMSIFNKCMQQNHNP